VVVHAALKCDLVLSLNGDHLFVLWFAVSGVTVTGLASLEEPDRAQVGVDETGARRSELDLECDHNVLGDRCASCATLRCAQCRQTIQGQLQLRGCASKYTFSVQGSGGNCHHVPTFDVVPQLRL
jgi:hypothetical protein